MKKLIIKLLFAFIGIGILAGASVALAFTYFNLDLPKIDKLQDYKPNLASQIISRDGVILAELGLEKREIVEMKNVPQRIIDAFLSAEDDKFFEHKGVDYWGLSRAMLANFKAGKVVQGGSTITQQVAKSLLLSSERSISRKVKDFILAQRIEEKLTKNEILYLYLNQVYLGGGYYGVKAAARGYYNKELKDVTVAEAAMLAGLLVAPGKYSPYVSPPAAKMRQGYVLERMYKLKKITEQEYKNAHAEKTVYRIREDDLKAGYFTEWVRQRAVEAVGEKSFLVDGYKIKTTLDWKLQKVAEEKLFKGAKDIDKRQGYKGPHSFTKLEDLDLFEKRQRIKLYRDVSTFFTIDEKNQKEFEHRYDEEKLNAFQENRQKIKAQMESDNGFQAGVATGDDLIEILNESKQYEAVVTGVDDASKVIFVSLGGSPGIIPFEYFKWAHKRSINENTAYWEEVHKPSTIVKVGDVVYVEVGKKLVNLYDHVSKDKQAQITKAKKTAIYKGQDFILCKLDQFPEVQGAVFSMDAKSGDVISYVGGTSFDHSKFNRVIQAKRQPGSAFKPILFAAALENGYNPSTIIMDTPEALPGFDAASSWKPKNYDGTYRGPVTFRVALEQSRNIPTIKIADKVGVNNIIRFADRIGFNAKLERDLSISLGTFGVSPRDMVMTYAIFANGGKYVMPRAIVSVIDRDGKVVEIRENSSDLKIPESVKESTLVTETEDTNPFTRDLMGNQVYDARLSYIMSNLLRGVVNSGTGGRARSVGRMTAGKTGTTNDYLDAWFVGFNPKVVTAVWNGFDDNRTMGYGEVGGKTPVEIWTEYMREVVNKMGEGEYEFPNGITQEWVNKETGKKAPANAAGAILESFAEVPVISAEEMPEGEAPVKVRPLGDDEYFENQ